MRHLGMAAGAALIVALGACESITEYIEGAQDAPLPGERISVIALQRTLRPDPDITDIDVRLPEPYLNEDWPQAGGRPTHAMHHLTQGDTPPSRAWTASAGRGASDVARLTAAPIVAGNHVFVLDAGGSVAAHRADDGTAGLAVQHRPGRRGPGRHRRRPGVRRRRPVPGDRVRRGDRPGGRKAAPRYGGGRSGFRCGGRRR